MIARNIEDRKAFTRELFIGDAFDHFLCSRITIHHDLDYVIDGRYHLDFFDNEEREEKKQQVYASWKEIQPLAFSIIKGKRLPLGFQIVLCVSKDGIKKLITQSDTSLTPEQVEGLFLNIIYRDEQLCITTGSSYTLFTPDKSLELAFEDAVDKLLVHLNIL